MFVVFPAEGVRSCATAAETAAHHTLDGPWSVSFDPKWGGPEKPVGFPALTDWTQHATPGIRYYSGTAVYRKTFDTPPNCPTDSPVTINLGDLRDVAHVTLNGQPLGVAWTPPYAVTAPRLKATGNVLEIAVVNLWANRLIGDAALRFRDAACAAGFPEENIYAAGYSMPRAVELAHACAHAGEVVLLSPACASFDMYDGMAQRGRDFKRLVRALPHAVSGETAESGGEA